MLDVRSMTLEEIIHYGELGELPGLHPTIAKRIRDIETVIRDDAVVDGCEKCKDLVSQLSDLVEENR